MKFFIYTLGCKVNTYESNIISELLLKKGYILDENADIVIINTCTVTNTASNKSLKMIRRAINKNNKAIVIVVGCLPQTELNEIKKIDNIAIVLGNQNKTKIDEYITKYLETKVPIYDIKDIMSAPFESMQLNNFNKTRAFVKIEDGCENYCSYCIIPYARGKVRSKRKDEVLEEICSLINNGHEEIVLTGIHTGHYGSDLHNYSFASLLKEILKIDGLKRLRISSIEITELNDEVLNIIKESEILVDHLHIPLQSGSDKILKHMNRKYDKAYFIDKINSIRRIRPNISITTDIIVGFPGETDELFNETIDTIKKINFSKIHVFPFSERKNTKAVLMDNKVNENVKKDRVKILLNLSKELEINYMNKFLNKEVEVLYETKKDNFYIGHTGNYLLVKSISNKAKVIINKIEYPYCVSNVK